MIPTLRPYPAYKDSGVPWLGHVPEHWEVEPLRTKARVVNGYPFDSEQFTTGPGFPLIRIRDLDKTQTAVRYAGPFMESARVNPGDVLIGMDGEFKVGIWRGTEPGLLNQRMCCVRAVHPSTERFLAYALPMPLQEINELTWSTTVKHLSSRQVERLRISFPPLPEQTAIVRFLDYVERRIRRFIRAKQKLIKLLEEYRQALIHQAVTGKIDVRTGKPYPAYKDSGVPWLGHVPQHWEVVKLKFISKRMQNGSTPPTDVGEYYADQGIPWYGPSSLLEEILIGLPVRFVTERAILDNKVRVIQPPALVISVIGNVGKSALMLEQGATNQQLTCCELDQKICNPVFVVNQFRMAEHYLVASASSTTIAILDSEVLRNMPLAIPPLPEQTAIVEYLDAQTAKLDAAIAAARREIELLREYRERLIADVVTGKVDVRQVAAQLPEEPAEEEAGTEEEEPVADELATVDSQEESNGEE